VLTKNTTCSIKAMVEDIIHNNILTKSDVQFIRECVQPVDININTLVELLSIANNLNYNLIDSSYQELLKDYLMKIYIPTGIIDYISAKEIIALFNPEEELSYHIREILKKLKYIKHGIEFQAFLDDNMI